MSVVSEEDMLVGALLWWLDDWAAIAEGESRTLPSRYELVPDVVDDLLDRRYSELGHPYGLAVLVADCERRWEVERAERAVLDAVDRFVRETYESRRDGINPPPPSTIMAANARLASAIFVRDNP